MTDQQQRINDQQQRTKDLITFSTAQFWVVTVGLFSFAAMFWSTTLTRLTLLEEKVNTGTTERNRIENKVDKISLNLFDLTEKVIDSNDKIIEIRTILDSRKK